MSARSCPECGTPRGPAAAPACGCGRRVADAALAARSADAAAAEDFDPLRIRPYVSLPDVSGPEASPPEAEDVQKDVRDTQEEVRDRQEDVQEDVPHREPVSESEPEPVSEPEPEPEPAPNPGREPRRPSRKVLLATAGTVAAVAIAAAVLLALIQEPGDQRALSDRKTGAPLTLGPSTPPDAIRKTAPRPTVSRRSPSPAPTRSVAPPPPPTTRAPSTPPTAVATGSVSTPTPERSAPPVLREGDTGPEVVELQLRLEQLYLYAGPAHGRYDVMVRDAVLRYQYAAQIEGDEPGVYGPATRKSLEAETEEP
ncbi:peptidoglycan-binding domain-containing protein [Streptomyces sp. NPDC002851]